MLLLKMLQKSTVDNYPWKLGTVSDVNEVKNHVTNPEVVNKKAQVVSTS